MRYFHFLQLVLVTIFISPSCKNTQNNKADSQESQLTTARVEIFPEIDLLEKYPQKKINLQDIADIIYIPLETNNDGLISAGNLKNILWKGDTIIVYRKNSINFFNRSGKFLYSFNHQGGSNEEYRNLSDITADFNLKEVYVHDYISTFRILTYSFDGKFKREIKISPQLVPSNIFNYNTDFLFCEDGYNMLDNNRPLNKTPYSLISKKTGEHTPLSIELTERIGGIYSTEGMIWDLSIETVMKTDKGVIISDFSLDTIYSLQNKTITPFALRKKQTSKAGNPLLATVEAVSNSYILWTFMERYVDIKKHWVPDKQYFLYDRNSGEISEIQIINPDFRSSEDAKNLNWPPSRYQAVIPDNCIIQPLPATTLIELYNKEQLSGPLKEIASKLQEEDNPVLTLIKFK